MIYHYIINWLIFSTIVQNVILKIKKSKKQRTIEKKKTSDITGKDFFPLGSLFTMVTIAVYELFLIECDPVRSFPLLLEPCAEGPCLCLCPAYILKSIFVYFHPAVSNFQFLY